MLSRCRVPFLAVLAVVIVSSGADGAEYRLISRDPPVKAFQSGPVPRSGAVVADSTLHDVCAVGRKCWAVGERGTILRSDDEGQTWSSRVLPADCSLRSVSFLTDKIGFVAGFALNPFTQTDQGVLLTTVDGGTTWQPMGDQQQLPGLRAVKFFDMDRGFVVATASGDQPGRLMKTEDGGLSWKLVKSDARAADWIDICFLRPSEGIVVGRRQSYGLLNSGKLSVQAYPRRTMQSVNAASLTQDGRAWLAGDGGFLLTSTNRGIGWKVPQSGFRRNIRDVFRFRTVVHRGDQVCVAGTPASSILRSDDAGANWTVVPCANGGSIERMVRVGTQSLLAVGSWGMIQRSDDFGRSWQRVRNGSLRSAMMYIVTSPEDASPVMLARVAGNDGYRVTAIQPSQQFSVAIQSARRETALAGLGVTNLETDWRFTRTRPGDEQSREGLIQGWNRASDGRLTDLLPLRMAVQLRTWRPNVVCIDSSGQQDAVADVWDSVIQEAISIADGSSPRSAELDELNIPIWSTGRVIRRAHDERTPLLFTPNDLLEDLATTAGIVAETWNVVAGINGKGREQSSSYSLTGSTKAATPKTVFQGIPVAFGSDARRELNQSEFDADELQAIVDRNRRQQAAITGQLSRAPLGSELIAHMQTAGSGLPDAMALSQLKHMARLYDEYENIEGRIAILQELARRVPNSAEAVNAADELHLMYSSAEILKLRKSELPKGDSDGQIPNAIPGLTTEALTAPPKILQAKATSLNQFKPSQGASAVALEKRWHQQAEQSWAILSRLAPKRATSSKHLLVKAARYRRHGKPSQEQTTLAQAAASEDHGQLLAANEMQANYQVVTPALPVHLIPQASVRPTLDGILGDVCWETAPEILLSESLGGAGVEDSLLMFSWDAEFLYLGGRLPSVEGRPPLAEAFDRSHDEADLTQDHIEFAFDVDRDYSTAWHFAIDSSGRTADRCWKLTRWNPEWFVATHRDDAGWQFEAAIPVKELQDQPLNAGRLWSIKIRRNVPGFADQKVAVSEEAQALSERYTMLRFIRNRQK